MIRRQARSYIKVTGVENSMILETVPALVSTAPDDRTTPNRTPCHFAEALGHLPTREARK
jgi:hypothetical protein